MVINPDGSMKPSEIPLQRLLRFNSYQVYAGGKTYLLFYDPNGKSINSIISDMVGYRVAGPVIVIQKHQSQYLTPTREQVSDLTNTEIKQKEECTLL